MAVREQPRSTPPSEWHGLDLPSGMPVSSFETNRNPVLIRVYLGLWIGLTEGSGQRRVNYVYVPLKSLVPKQATVVRIVHTSCSAGSVGLVG